MQPKALLASIVWAILLGGCVGPQRASDTQPISYSLEVVDDAQARRFRLRLSSSDARDMCFPVEQWPSAAGTVDTGSQRAWVLVQGQAIPALDDNFGLCPGGCGYIRVPAGQTLAGAIGYDQFPTAQALLERPDKSLRLNVYPVPCRKDMAFVHPR